jgi:hypothetical protein
MLTQRNWKLVYKCTFKPLFTAGTFLVSLSNHERPISQGYPSTKLLRVSESRVLWNAIFHSKIRLFSSVQCKPDGDRKLR